MKSFTVAGGRSISLALFSDVSNSRELLDLMQSGTLEPEAAFLNASLVPDVFPVLAAAHKALLSNSRGSLTTRTLHSELVYNYSGSKHISESLKRCGIADDTQYILAARFDASDDEEMAKKCYVVYIGRVPGVYEEWDDCAKQVNTFSGNLYQGYASREVAEDKWRKWRGHGRKKKWRSFIVIITALLLGTLVGYVLYSLS